MSGPSRKETAAVMMEAVGVAHAGASGDAVGVEDSTVSAVGLLVGVKVAVGLPAAISVAGRISSPVTGTFAPHEHSRTETRLKIVTKVVLAFILRPFL